MIDRRSYTEYASAARTAAPTSVKRDGRFVRGLTIYLDITALTATGTLTVSVNGYTLTPTAVAFMTAAAAAAATGRFVYILAPEDMAASAGVTQVTKLPVPFEYTVEVTPVNGVSITYSVKVETF